MTQQEMTQQDLLDEFVSLPVEAQRQVSDFVSFLRQKYETKVLVSADATAIENDEFIGMWKDREDLVKSSDWVRNLRENEWSR